MNAAREDVKTPVVADQCVVEIETDFQTIAVSVFLGAILAPEQEKVWRPCRLLVLLHHVRTVNL